ncbi:otoferlin-like [Pieris brassicae]|uniref:otoferlin-like n=1 Tax=Pieris brassicae TaxID=7116 RepID=UPI001E65FD6D|nr:otoferlin-like [Pieris brassicae]
MLSTSSEQFERQKAISINVIEGRKLAWFNPHSANSYVIVVYGKKKSRTSLRRNMLEPYYNEVLTFDTCANIEDILKTNVWVAIMEPRCYASPRILGETSIDLNLIWTQPNHQAVHKWVQLYLPRNHSFGPVGFLKLCISISFRGEMLNYSASVRNEKVEETLLLSGSEQQCANYQITIYEAFGLPCSSRGDRRYTKPPSTYVKVFFCGLVARTAIQSKTNNPKYYEQISIVEMFPNMSRVIRIEVWSTEDNTKKPLASTHLSLENISYDGENGFLPTFGPSLLHMYGACNASDDGPYHTGAVLISLNTIVPYYQNNLRTVHVEPTSLQIDDIWQTKEICLNCSVFEVSMLDREVVGKACGVAITFGEISSLKHKDEAFLSFMNDLRTHKYHYTGCLNIAKVPPYGYLDFSGAFPVLQIATYLPDYRFRMFKHNMVEKIIIHLETTLGEIERHIECKKEMTDELLNKINSCLNDTACSILNFLGLLQTLKEENITYNPTELDKKEIALLNEEMEKIYYRISNRISSVSSLSGTMWKCSNDETIVFKKAVKSLLFEGQLIADSLKKIQLNAPHGWPDIIVWLLNDGSRVAYAKLSPTDYLFSDVPEQVGKFCGKIQTLIMKPLKCPYHVTSVGCICMVGKAELSFWLGTYQEKSAFEFCVPPGYRLKLKGLDKCLRCSSTIVEVRAFIYKAKILNQSSAIRQGKLFVRINIFNSVKETEEICYTHIPLWNQVLKTQKMFFVPPERLWTSPPHATVEIVNVETSGKREIIGRVLVRSAVDDRQDYAFAPKLEWYELYTGVECTGEILMSIQTIQVVEKFVKSTLYSPLEDSFMVADFKEIDEPDTIEPLPSTLIPKLSTYKVDVYWWGLRDVNITRKPCVTLEIDNVVIKSNIIIDKKMNSNFQNGRMSATFQADDLPMLNIRLHDSSTFGRTLYLGANAVKNPKKFIVDCIPQQDRDASLQRASIISSDFLQVSPNLCVKKNSQSKWPHSIESDSINASMNNIRRSYWHRLCCSEPAEEEYILLPVVKNKQKCQNKCALPKTDWWTRYVQSLENYARSDVTTDHMTIYDSELELQPQFSKLRDWCSAIKLYYKKGRLSENNQLICGRIKAGLAIYRWPPPGDTVNVSASGVDLNKGYFDDHPNNDPAKFLIRVYIIRAFNLKTKEFGKSDPYTVVNCGKKHFGNRADYVANSWNPIFTKVHEFRCNIPEEYKITISLYDYNAIPPDEIIGSTTVDLEDRIYTKHRARVGLSKEFTLNEQTKWRDCVKPSEILADLCQKNHLLPPVFLDTSAVVINGVKYVDEGNHRDITYSSTERKENLCLSILHKWHTIPICGYHLVPEHVETRFLYNDDKPGIEQGQLHMWVDIFPLQCDTFIPPPLEIKPFDLEEFELHIAIDSVRDVELNNLRNNLDLFVRAWLGSSENAQEKRLYTHKTTDKFNCQMIFSFQYQLTAKKLHTKEVGALNELRDNLSPLLVVQIIEMSTVAVCLGTLKLNLNEMSQGTNHLHDCNIERLEMGNKVDLFTIGTHRAWWPLQTLNDRGNTEQSGLIEMDLNLIRLEKATLFPVDFELPFPQAGPSHKDVESLSKRSFHFCRRNSTNLLLLLLGVIIIIFVTSFFYLDLPAMVSYYWYLLWPR